MQCRETEAQRDKADRKLRHAQMAVSEICGRARNSYSKGVLKKDFKDGLLEMEETAADVELDARAGPSGIGHCLMCELPCCSRPCAACIDLAIDHQSACGLHMPMQFGFRVAS